MVDRKTEVSEPNDTQDNIVFTNEPDIPNVDWNTVQVAIDNFILSIEGIREITPFMQTVFYAFEHKHEKAFESERDSYGTVVEESNDAQKIEFPRNRASKAIGIAKDLSKIRAARDTLPNMLLLSMVSLYDAYLVNLLKALFRLQPNIIFTSEKQVSFSEIAKSGSLDVTTRAILS